MVDAHAMTQDERRLWLIRALKEERAEYARLEIPAREADQRDLLRALFNVSTTRSTRLRACSCAWPVTT